MKICDFGLAFAFEPFTLNATKPAGTPDYAAPEVFSFHFANRQSEITNRAAKFFYDEKVDVWSYGMVLWSLFTAKEPFGDVRLKSESILREHWEKLQNDPNYRPKIPTVWPADKEKKMANEMNRFKEVMKKCWQVNTNDRPSFTDIVQQMSPPSQPTNTMEG